MLYLYREQVIFADCRSFKSAKKLGSANRKSTNYTSANHKKDWVRKIANPLSATFANLTNFQFAILWISDLRNLFANPPLVIHIGTI